MKNVSLPKSVLPPIPMRNVRDLTHIIAGSQGRNYPYAGWSFELDKYSHASLLKALEGMAVEALLLFRGLIHAYQRDEDLPMADPALMLGLATLLLELTAKPADNITDKPEAVQAMLDECTAMCQSTADLIHELARILPYRMVADATALQESDVREMTTPQEKTDD